MILIRSNTPSKSSPLRDERRKDLKYRKPAKESDAVVNVLSDIDGSAALYKPPETERLTIMGTAIKDRIK